MENKKYYCPNCGKGFKTEDEIKKHFLPCWQRINPDYKSKPAPLTEDIHTTEVDDNVLDFFNSFN